MRGSVVPDFSKVIVENLTVLQSKLSLNIPNEIKTISRIETLCPQQDRFLVIIWNRTQG